MIAIQVKARTKKLSELFKSYQPYDDQVGQVQSVLVTDVSHDKKYYVAHNKQYVQVFKKKIFNYLLKETSIKQLTVSKQLTPEVLYLMIEATFNGLSVTSYNHE